MHVPTHYAQSVPLCSSILSVPRPSLAWSLGVVPAIVVHVPRWLRLTIQMKTLVVRTSERICGTISELFQHRKYFFCSVHPMLLFAHVMPS